MKLNSSIENFYKAILDYAGLLVEEDGSIVVNSKDRKPIKGRDGKVLHLPYLELLKQPDGKMFFHLLNENFLRPEGEAFNLYRDNLLLEINSKLTYLMTVLIELASRPDLQKSIKSRELLDIMSQVGGGDEKVNDISIDMATTLRDKVLMKAISENGSGGFVDFFIRKNGEIDGVDYRVVGKANFFLYKELNKALEEKEYKLFGVTVRKKDILVYLDILEAIFPNMDNESEYSAGSDNVVFGYLNVLLSTSFIVTNRINHVIEIIARDLSSTELITLEDQFSLAWTELLEEMYGLTKEIRLIPNQDDVSTPTKKLKVNEKGVRQGEVAQQPIEQKKVNNEPPQFNPQMTQQPIQQPQQVHQQQEQGQMSLEQMVANMSNFNNQPQFGYQQPMMNPYMQPMQPQQPQMPMWMQQQMMQRQQPQQHAQQPAPQFQNPYGGNPYLNNPYGMTGGVMQPQYGYQQYPYNQYNGGYGQPQQQYGYDAFSQIEPSSLNGG